MIHRILFIACLIAPLGAWGKSHSSASPSGRSLSQTFFLGLEASPDDDLASETKTDRKKYASLEEALELTIQQRGVNVMNIHDHGVASQEEFRVRKAKSQFPVLHFDVSNIRRIYWNRFNFDIEFARGSEFFAEQETAILHECQAIEQSDGKVIINLEGCIKRHYKRLAEG